MKDKVFKIIAYLLPIGLVAFLAPVLLAIIRIFEPGGIIQYLLGKILLYNFNAFWYGGIPYLLFLVTAFFIRSRLKRSRLDYSHLYSPLLFAIVFFLFWLLVFEISGKPPINPFLYLKTFLLPISLYTAIGGYGYLSLAGLLYLKVSKSGKND